MEKYRFSGKEQKNLEQMPVPMAVYQFVDEKVFTLSLSEGYCRLFGFPDHPTAYRLIAEDAFCNTHPDDTARVKDAAYRFAKEGGRYEVIFRSMKYGGGAYHIIHGIGEHIYTEEGIRLAYVWYTDEGGYTAESEDSKTTPLNRAFNTALQEESMLRASYYSYITGLPSMSYFFELAQARSDAIIEDGGRPTLLYMDFYGMKRFNAKYGFAEGDVLLKAFVRCLQSIFPDDICSHFGADRFAVLTNAQGVEERLDALCEKCRELNSGKNLPVHVGLYQQQSETVSVAVACDRAKTACDSLKHTYSSGYAFYSQRIQEDEENRQYIIENLDRAIKENWIQIYTQSIIRAVNERVCDVEALARWIDPEKGFLSPADFIPALEDAGLIYKLDLYMVDQTLKSMKDEKAAGFYIVPHSINLSRSDFDSCDMVEEIRKRVDEAGVDRSLISIEITESVIGRDIKFMKEQVERFRKLGFPVWMDDFGSGYSSLDVLQSIPFDLIKFDMSFMRKLDEGNGGKIILTELMKMATSLGVDTVCEGVETEEQVRFLREIGCSKLQGYYYSKPVPFEKLKALSEGNTLIQRENPEESKYYERIGRVNLFDLSFLANMDDSVTKNTFDTIPMGIMEVNAKGDKVKYVRSNQPFCDFMRRAFGFDLSDPDLEYPVPREGPGSSFMKAIEQSKENNNRAFVDEKIRDGAVARSFVRVIGKNPVTGKESVAIAVLSISEPSEGETFADIAQALAADYYNIYVIDLDTNNYIEYSSQVGGEEMSLERHGGDFFESARRDTMTRIYEEDRETFLALFTRENVLRDIEKQGVFTTIYRLIDTGKPMYVNMKITRMHGGNRLILGVSIIDAHMREKERYEQLQKERETLAKMMALSDGYLTLFTIDLKTGNYIECSSSEAFDSLGAKKVGNDFFGQAFVDAYTYCYVEDRRRFQEQVTQENVLREIREHGNFSINYRLIIKDVPTPVTLRAALYKDRDDEKLIVGVRAWKDRH